MTSTLIFDDGVLKNLSDLTDVSVPQSRISYARTNGSGEVDLIALSSTTGELYGRVSVYTETSKTPVKDSAGKEPDDAGWTPTYSTETTTKISVDVNGTTYGPYTSGYGVRSGDFVAFKVNSGKTGFSQMLTLDKLSEVASTAWIGKTAVNYGGRTYTVPSDVLCWNRDGGSWLDGGAEAALAYGGTMNLYVRDGVVRVIEVRG